MLKRVWPKALFWALVILVAGFSLIELTDRVFIRPKSIFEKSVADFEKQKAEIEILFCGQSDVKYGIDPYQFDCNTFNFAGNGESFIETYYKLKHYIQDMPKLKIVVLSITLHSFSSARAEEIDSEYFTHGYISYADFLDLYKLMGIRVVREKLLSFCPNLRKVRMVYFLHNVKRLLTNQTIDKTEIYKGYISFVGSSLAEKDTIQRVNRNFKGKVIFDKNVLIFFEKILEMCENNNIKVVTLTLPLTDDFLKYSEKYITEDLLYKNILHNPRYSKYIYKHIDLLEDDYAKNHELFYNQDHLNHEGALKFSKLIASELSEIMRETNDVKQLPNNLVSK
jgi:hypothetical protein